MNLVRPTGKPGSLAELSARPAGDAAAGAEHPSRRGLIAALGGSMFLLAGCSSSTNSNSSSSGGGATGTAAAGDVITIQNFAFAPASLTVAAGTTITVTNKDSVTHTVTASDSQKSFDTGDIPSGATVTFKAPDKAGAYAYNCTIHPYMHGTLTVQ